MQVLQCYVEFFVRVLGSSHINVSHKICWLESHFCTIYIGHPDAKVLVLAIGPCLSQLVRKRPVLAVCTKCE